MKLIITNYERSLSLRRDFVFTLIILKHTALYRYIEAFEPEI